jgi:hypothetical protein
LIVFSQKVVGVQINKNIAHYVYIVGEEFDWVYFAIEMANYRYQGVANFQVNSWSYIIHLVVDGAN